MYTDFLYTHYLYNKNVHVYTWSYKYRTVEILEPILSIHSNSSRGAALLASPSFETRTKGTCVVCVVLRPELDALEERGLVRSHPHDSEQGLTLLFPNGEGHLFLLCLSDGPHPTVAPWREPSAQQSTSPSSRRRFPFPRWLLEAPEPLG